MRFLTFVAGIATAAWGQSASVELTMLKSLVLEERVEMVSRKMLERQATLENLFTDVGCSGEYFTTQKVPGSRSPNLICTLKGTDPEAGVIVVGGHYDFIDAGMGAIDDWSGSVMLPSLYQSLKGQARRHDYVFIAFAAEEKGLVGSREYVNKLKREQKVAIKAMINLECLGITPPGIWASRADPKLLESYTRVISSLKIPPKAVNVERVGDDDSHSFRDAKIPTLTIHSLTQETWRMLHSPRDKVSAINAEDYYDAYRAAALLLAYLDGK